MGTVNKEQKRYNGGSMEELVLAVSNSYERKYYFNQEFEGLPDQVKEDIQVMLVMFTMEIGGILSLIYKEDQLSFVTEADGEDILYDEIGAHLKIKQLQVIKQDLLESLEEYYKVFYLA